jgi:PAS domain S-box-containing protein
MMPSSLNLFSSHTVRTTYLRALLLFLGVLANGLTCHATGQQPSSKRVLELFSSSDRNDEWWNLVENSMRARVPGQITFYRAYLEDSRLTDMSYRESQVQALRNTYAGTKIDLVMTTFTPELQFTLQYRDKLFPGVPIVFSAISARELEGLKLGPGVTGMTVPVGIKETIDLALQLQPDTNTVAIVASPSTTGMYWLAAAHTELLLHQDKVREIDLVGPASEQLLERVAGLPDHTVVLFELGPEDSSRPAFGIYDLLPAVARRFPTYSPWTSLCLNYGCIGGAYEDTRKENLWLGEMASRVLLGERPVNIPVLHSSDLQIRVDSRTLRQWNIPLSALPPGTEILYAEPSFWQQYKKYAIATFAVIAVQFLLIVGLLWQRARRRKAQAGLRESEKRFRVMADTTPSLIWMCDAEGKITYLNKPRIAFTGAEPNATYGDAWTPFVHTDDLRKVQDAISNGVKKHERFSVEYRLRRRDAVYRWMFDVAAPRFNGDGSFAGFIGSAVDVTDQRMAQEALEKVSGQLIEAQEKERSRLARELHDDFSQRLALLSIGLGQLWKTLPKSGAADRSRVQEMLNGTKELASDLHALSHQLHSSRLEHVGVVSALEGLCKEFSEKHKIEIQFSERDLRLNMPKEVDLCLFRVAQEALNNIVKHSQAKSAQVEIGANTNRVSLRIRDDGKGFDSHLVNSDAGIGLTGMRERIRLVGGSLLVRSELMRGTEILAQVPLSASIDKTDAKVEAVRK